jgi:hypothetical protein
VNGACMGMGVGYICLGIDASCGLTYSLERRTESGTIGLVSGLYCDVISNAIVVIVWGVDLQNGKWVAVLCMLLVDRLQDMDV